jgi:hypothetical protein
MSSTQIAIYFLAAAYALAQCGCHARTPPDSSPTVPAVLALARPDLVGDRYRNWKTTHEATSSRRNLLTIPLRFAKGRSAEPTHASGRIQLDLENGIASVDVLGFRFGDELDVWLLYSSVDSERSPTKRNGQRRLRIGTLRSDRAGAHLEVEIGAERLGAVDIDEVILCRSGSNPENGLLFGAPTVFERLYEQERNGRLEGSIDEEIERLVRLGAELFEREDFDGNGRTCTTCHPASNNLTIDARFIAMLPADDPLFVFERVPELAELENATLLRARGLILENLDGFENPGVMRGVPHIFALTKSIDGPDVPFDNTLNPERGIQPPRERTGWSGDGAPGSGSLRDFATGAVIQHFPRTLARRAGRDFRLPTDEELDALEIFQLALGRDEDLEVDPSDFLDPLVAKGAEIFMRTDTEGGSAAAGKCTLCHSNGGANIDPEFFSAVLGVPVDGNANFGTGVNELAALPARILDPSGTPRDGGFGRVPHDGESCVPPHGGFGTVTPPGGVLPAGLCEEDFNTPPLVEAADTPPFFHNNAVDSLETAVAFYNDRAFNESAGGQILASLDTGGIGIRLDATEVGAVAAFLRVLNALENIHLAETMSRAALETQTSLATQRLVQAPRELRDAIRVLEAVALHVGIGDFLQRADDLITAASKAHPGTDRDDQIREAVALMQNARDVLVEPR